MERLRQAPIPLPSPRPPPHYFLWHFKEDHVVSGSQEGPKGSEKCLSGGGHWHRGRGCWLRLSPPQRCPRTLTHRAGFVCGRPLEGSQGQCQAPLLASPGESLPQPQGHKENGSSLRHGGQRDNSMGCFSVMFPRSHPHEESRRGEA